ncbi:MAG: hypothetical protein Q8L37_05015 [Candidatus Gottesmanbacteria bacterium]|nr:hypothetical protein [Candidatus Gottesmanbacteria bacterium]
MPQAVDLNERVEQGIPRPRDVHVIQEEIDKAVATDAGHFCKEFGIEITQLQLEDLERLHGVHMVLYALHNYPDHYLDYLKNPKAFPQRAAQVSLFEFSQK